MTETSPVIAPDVAAEECAAYLGARLRGEPLPPAA